MKRVYSVGDLCISCEIDVYGSAYSILRNETKRNIWGRDKECLVS